MIAYAIKVFCVHTLSFTLIGKNYEGYLRVRIQFFLLVYRIPTDIVLLESPVTDFELFCFTDSLEHI